MPSEKIEVTATPVSEAEFENFMRGDGREHSDGSRFASEPEGFGSGVEMERERLRAGMQQPAPPLAEERLYDTSPEQQLNLPQQGQDFQQLYGRSENEKGQWRRTAEEAMAALEQTKAELAMLRAMQTNPQSYATPQQGYQASTPAPQVDYNSMIPQTFFPNRQPGEIPEVGEIDAVIRNQVAPAVMQLWQQQQALAQQQIAAQKAVAGITPAVEQKMYASYPWLQNIPDGAARVAAMQDIVRSSGRAPSPSASAPRPLVDPAQAAARRVTYVESGKPASPDGTKTAQQILADEFAKAKTAAEKRAVLMKFGAQQVNDFGPDTLTR